MGRSIWVWAAVLVLVGMVAYGAFRGSSPSAPSTGQPQTPGSAVSTPRQQQPSGNAIAISIASSNTKEEWLHQAVRAFNAASQTDQQLQVNGKPIAVEILQEDIDGKKVDYRSGTMVADTLDGKIQPTIVSPGEEAWLVKLNKEWRGIHGKAIMSGDAPILVRTPLVLGMWQSRAKALGCWPNAEPECTWERIRVLATSPNGWEMLGQPAWRKFKLGYGYFGESNSGTLSVVLFCMMGSKKTSGLAMADVEPTSGCGQMIAAIEKAKVHSGKSSGWLLDRMSAGPEYLDAVITYESDIIAFNRSQGSKLREPLVSVYPQDGTVVVGHPFAILDGAPWVTAEQVEAASLLRKFLLSPQQQEAVLSLGLRPADPNVKLVSPIDQSNGANPQAKLVTVELPDALVIDRVGEVWRQVKKHAMIAVVFDKSGSMRGEKLTAAIAGAKEFINWMGSEDQLFWMPFDNRVYPGVKGTKAAVGERLLEEIVATTAGGGTSLYDAVFLAFQMLEEQRAIHGDTYRYGIVVLSDGKDENSGRTLAMLEAKLQPLEHDATGIQIHTIAIGTDADERVLKKIANMAHGKYWKGQTAKQIVTVYKDIAAHY